MLNIHEASNFLGVSEATLRLWTDESQVKAFITPGGHRRYDLDELKRFYASRQKVLSIKDMAAKLELTSATYRQVAHEHVRPEWFKRLSHEDQQELLGVTQSLFNLTINFIKSPAQRKQISQAAQLKGEEFGTLLAKLELSLTESVEAFLSNRGHTIDFMADLIKKNTAQDKRVLESLPSLNHMLDEVLLSLITAHQKYVKPKKNKTERVSQN